MSTLFLTLLACRPPRHETPPTPSVADRVSELEQRLCCAHCPGASLADGEGPIAQASQARVAALVAGGASDDEVLAHFSARYGDWIVRTAGDTTACEPPGTSSPVVGRPAPTLTVRGLDGEVVLVAPGAPTVLHFWATWCPPCSLDRVLLRQAAQRLPEVDFLDIAYMDDAAAVQAVLLRDGPGYPSAMDVNGATGVDYGVTGVPETFFVDAGGIVRSHVIGVSSPDTFGAHADTITAGASDRLRR